MSARRTVAVTMAFAEAAMQAAFEDLPIFRRERGVALYNCAVAQTVDAYKALVSPQITALNETTRWFVEASIWAIPAIFQRCCDDPTVPLSTDEQTFSEAHELLDFAHKREQVHYSLTLANRGQMTIHAAKREPRLTFAYTTPAASTRDTALRAAEDGADGRTIDQQLLDDTQRATVAVDNQLRTRVERVSAEACRYDYDDAFLVIVRDLVEQYFRFPQYNDPLGLDANVAIGEVTMAEVRRVWAALAAIQYVHATAQLLAAGGKIERLPIQTVVLCRESMWFSSIVSRLSGVPEDRVAEILGWHTYDLTIARDKPSLQPLLPLQGDRLAVLDLFVLGNNFERNFLKLFDRHPTLRAFTDAVNSTKEPTALRQLSTLFPEPRFRTESTIRIPGVTDADLVAYDSETAFLLVIQHKWLLAPDTVLESAANDDRLQGGVRQAVQAREHFRRDPTLAQMALELRGLRIGRIEAVVVSRGSEPTGFVELDPTVPVVEEGRFHSLRSVNESLPSLWDALVRRPDHERAAAKAEDVITRFRLAGWEFRFPGMQLDLSHLAQRGQ